MCNFETERNLWKYFLCRIISAIPTAKIICFPSFHIVVLMLNFVIEIFWIDYSLTRQQCIHSSCTTKAIKTAVVVDMGFPKLSTNYLYSRGKQNHIIIKRDNCAFTSWSADKMLKKIFNVNIPCFSCYFIFLLSRALLLKHDWRTYLCKKKKMKNVGIHFYTTPVWKMIICFFFFL